MWLNKFKCFFLLGKKINHYYFKAFSPFYVAQTCDIKSHTITQDSTSVISLFQDCLRACQEQIERVLTSSLQQGQQYQQESAARAANKTREQQESSTPTDVRDVNL